MSEDTKQEDLEPEAPAAEETEADARSGAKAKAEVDTDIEAEEPVEQTVEQPEQTPQDRIAALEEEVAELKDRLLRAVAETENVRRRARRDKEDMAKYAISNFSRDMLTVADNMARALNSVDEETRKNNGAIENLLIGVEMTERELLAAFERAGIKRMEPLGQRFDPNVHEAMFEYDDATCPAGSIGQVIETGYMLHTRILRPAKVGIARGGPKLEAEPKTQASDASAEASAYEKPAEQSGEHVGEHLNEEL